MLPGGTPNPWWCCATASRWTCGWCPGELGAALHYLTGSKAHNIAVRHLGVQRASRSMNTGSFGERRASPARPRRRCSPRWTSPTSSRSCGKTGGNRGRPTGKLPGSSPWRISRATCTPTPRPLTAATPWRRWPRPPGSGAISTWPSPTTPNR